MSVPYKSTPHGLIAQESNDFWLVTFARFFTDSTTMSLDKFLNSILISKPPTECSKSETKQAHFGGQRQNGQKKQESHAQ